MKALSPDQLTYWDQNGYIAFNDHALLTPDERVALGATVDDIAGGKRPDLPEDIYSVEGAVRRGEITDIDRRDRYRIVRFLHKYDELVRSICMSPRILDVVEDLLGPDIKLYTDQVFMKPAHHGGAQGWHQDSGSWTMFQPHDHVTCWIAIDEATEENGCLHYLNGSHKLGYVEPQRTRVLVDQLQKEAPESEVLVPRKPGYAVLHHSLTLHATGPNQTPNRRRGIALHYMRANTRYIPIEGDRPGPYLLVRGKEVPGRV